MMQKSNTERADRFPNPRVLAHTASTSTGGNASTWTPSAHKTAGDKHAVQLLGSGGVNGHADGPVKILNACAPLHICRVKTNQGYASALDE